MSPAAMCTSTFPGSLLGGAATGFRPFYLSTIAAGTLRVPFAPFFVISLCGRVNRFTTLVGLPHALMSAL